MANAKPRSKRTRNPSGIQAAEVLPRPSAILNDLTRALAYEASRLAALAEKKKLSSLDRRALTDFIRALSVLSQEDERMRKLDAVATLSDEQLRELAAKLLIEG